MKYTEFGIENDKTLMIFPGGGVYWNPAAMPFVETASKHFHLIVVAYDGFNGEEKDAVISDDVLENSYEHEGNCAAAYIKEHFNGKIDVMYGCSADAWMLLETLNHDGIAADTVGTYDRSFRKVSKKQIPAGVCYQMKVVKNCGHGGLFSEPKRMTKAITAAGNHEKGYVI